MQNIHVVMKKWNKLFHFINNRWYTLLSKRKELKMDTIHTKWL